MNTQTREENVVKQVRHHCGTGDDDEENNAWTSVQLGAQRARIDRMGIRWEEEQLSRLCFEKSKGFGSSGSLDQLSSEVFRHV